MKEISHFASSITPSIFSVATQQAIKTGSINLAQGFPDFDGPDFAIKALIDEAKSTNISSRQYAPAAGAKALREKLSEVYLEQYNTKFDPQSEILITNGATEALFLSAMALFNEADEVILFGPFYDSYQSNIEMMKSTPIYCNLDAPNFDINFDHLKSIINTKTKAIYFNNPHNPSGKVFSKAEIQKLIDICIENDIYLISDEVYEYLTYDDSKFNSVSQFPEIKHRSLVISSAGKTFGLTGLKVGWVLGNQRLIHALTMVHQFNTFCVNHPAQLALVKILDHLKGYQQELQKIYQYKRDLLFEGLKKKGLCPILPQASYFILCELPKDVSDIEYCEQLMLEKKVAALPCSPFYEKDNGIKNLIRFCFAKENATLEAAIASL